MTTSVHVAHDFSPLPMGRTHRHGPYNGSRFRDEFLVPALLQGPTLVDLTGTRGKSASFLEEAFARLLDNGFTFARLQKALRIRADDDPLVEGLIWDLISHRAERLTNTPS